MTSQPQLSTPAAPSPSPVSDTGPAPTTTDATTPAAPGLDEPAATPAAAVTAAPADPAAPGSTPGRFGGARRKPLLLGFFGCLLMAVAGLGAGGKLVADPILEGTPLVAMRFGHGYDLAVLAVYVGLGLVLWGWVLLGRDVIARRVAGRGVLFTALAWIGPMLVSPPLFTRDPYSYLAYGTMPLRGFDPYDGGPNQMLGPIAQNVHWFWTDTPAPYGPLFILVAKGVAAITGENMVLGVILMRLAMLPGLVLFLVAVPGLVRHLGGRVPVALWLAVANPVMVLHLIGGPHNDLLLVGLLTSGTLLVLNGRHVPGIALATGAMAVKATAGFALPFLVLVWAARLSGSERSRILRAATAGIGVFLVVFTAISVAARVGIGWLPALNAPSNIVNWLSLPTGVGELLAGVTGMFLHGLSSTPFVTVTRILGIVVFFWIAVKQWLKSRDGGPEAVRRAGLVLLLFALLSPATLPWYYAWGMVLLAATPWTVQRMQIVVVASIFLMVSAFPSGEVALYAWFYLFLMAGCAVVAARSLTREDPLGLRRRPWPPPTPERRESGTAEAPTAEARRPEPAGHA